jgi:nitrate/TMAO reductase-like tetraheme cytochrome c subunit
MKGLSMARVRALWQSMRGWQRWTLAGAGLALFLFLFFVASFEAVHYTETTEFCSTCHTVMEPEFVPHRLSAHASVTCADCHIGPGIQATIYYKISAVRYLWTLPLSLYHRPLASPRETMRSTKEICEQCHSTATFQPLSVRTAYEYAFDEANTPRRVLLARKIGNGLQPVVGQDLGAHWHTQNEVTFFTTDELRQYIPLVQVEKDGETITYVDSEADPATYANAEAQKQVMDCIDCHSREGHTVYRPADMVDQAMAQGRISTELPSIKAQSVAVLDQRYATGEEGLAAIVNSLTEFYQTQYPAVYGQRQAEVEQAIKEVQRIHDYTHFPAMNVYWDTYPNDIGHKDFPGCMRCHNGSHLSEEGEAIPAECTLCHMIPQEAGPDEPLPAISIAYGERPESHQSSRWIAEHRFRFDATCDDCHTISDPGGISNSSFCSNSGCHAREWRYLRINTPAVLALAVPQKEPGGPRLPRLPHPVVENMDCQQCHGLDKVLAFPEDHAEYGQDECQDCHRFSPEVLADMPTPAAPTDAVGPAPFITTIPTITHTLAGNEDCLACHAVNSTIAPAPRTHATFDNTICLDCHELAPGLAGLPTAPPPTPSPTATLPVSPTVAVTPATPEPTATMPVTPTETITLATPAVTITVAASAPVTTAVSPALAATIPHPVAGNENCLACHAVTSSIAPAPPNHLNLPIELCQDCHLPATE